MSTAEVDCPECAELRGSGCALHMPQTPAEKYFDDVLATQRVAEVA